MAPWHVGMLACWHVGMLACWHVPNAVNFVRDPNRDPTTRRPDDSTTRRRLWVNAMPTVHAIPCHAMRRRLRLLEVKPDGRTTEDV